MAKAEWLKYFEDVPEPRVERTRLHSLSDIILMVLVGAICDCRGWDDIVDMMDDGPVELLDMFEFKHGIPSADTLRRVMGALNPTEFEKSFIAWAMALSQTSEGKLIAIDGKTVRGALRAGEETRALHLVNAWMDDNSLALGQFATSLKSNEITAIPELLRLISLRGAVVTADAMGCQKEIAALVRERGADYVFGLKGNQPTLQAEVLNAFDDQTRSELEQSAETYHEESDKGHGRLELRRTWVLRDLTWISHQQDWLGLNSLVLVESHRTINGRTSVERRTYISSLDASAQVLGSAVRRHWGIENKLHWVLDVTFGEDAARISNRNAAQNLALIRKISLNLLKTAPDHRKPRSIAAKKRLASRRVDYLVQVLSSGNPVSPVN
jgi:predicted transposase YbfD/YdcC